MFHIHIALDGDFHSFNETVRFNAGEREAMVVLRVKDDLRVESQENFTLSLFPTTNPDPFSMSIVFLPIHEAVLQIQDNDGKCWHIVVNCSV